MVASMSAILYAVSFFFASPDFHCSKIIDSSDCNMDYFCTNFGKNTPGSSIGFSNGGWPTYSDQDPDKANFYVNWKYDSWTQNYNLVCDNSSYKETALLLVQIVPGLLCIIAPMMSDWLGRSFSLKFCSWIILILTAALFSVGFFFDSLGFKLVALMLFVNIESVVICIFSI